MLSKKIYMEVVTAEKTWVIFGDIKLEFSLHCEWQQKSELGQTFHFGWY